MIEKPSLDIEGMQGWATDLMASRAPDFVIGDNYLRRWWVIPRNSFTNIYLHEINRSDDDRALHDHPWENYSFLIKGSYIEHTPDASFVRKAGDIVKRPATYAHRLELINDEPVISLFVTGPHEREWGFHCPKGWRHWREFASETNPGKPGRGCD